MKKKSHKGLAFFAMVLALLVMLLTVLIPDGTGILRVLALLLYAIGFYILPKNKIENGKDEIEESPQPSAIPKEENNTKKVLVKTQKREAKTAKITNPIVRDASLDFPDLFHGAELKYAYYDVALDTTTYSDTTIREIGTGNLLDLYISRYSNTVSASYYSNSLKEILHIGSMPDSKLKEMVFDYSERDGYFIKSFISQVNEVNKTIQIALGFYRTLSEKEIKAIPHIDATLIRTKKKDFMGYSRMDNLFGIQVGDTVYLDYDFETETYWVSNNLASEIGEINVNNSQKLQEYEEDGYELDAYAIFVDDEDADNVKCKVRVIPLKNGNSIIDI